MSASDDAASEAVQATVDIAASPERVFEALTDPSELAAWWGAPDAPDGYRTHDWELDARAGGRYRARTTDADGHEGTLEGEVVTAEPPHLLEYTWRASWDDRETRVRYELQPAIVHGRSGTRVVVRHTAAINAMLALAA